MKKDSWSFVGVTFVLLAIAAVLNWYIGGVAYSRRVHNPQTQILSDVALNSWASVGNTLWPDIMAYVDLGGTALLCVVASGPQWKFVTGRYFLVLGVVFLMRSSTIALVSLPDPDPACAGDDPDAASWFPQCGALMFSGHTTIFMVGALIRSWNVYSLPSSNCLQTPWPLWWILNVLYATAGITGVMVCRLHYIFDVVIAIYLSFLTYLTVEKFEWLMTYECGPSAAETERDIAKYYAEYSLTSLSSTTRESGMW